MIKRILSLLLILFSVSCFAQNYRIAEIVDIAHVPAAFPVGFALQTHGDKQFVAYYDSAKNMTVASRNLNSSKWDYKVLDTRVGWDSHNYIAMKIDAAGYLHVSGNMHCVPLIYYRSAKPLDIQSLERVTSLVGHEENRMTYPNFMDGPNGEFLYHYRHGESGNGYEVYDKWNPQTMTWSRYLDKPLIDGEGKRNAYMVGPRLGPDNYFHMIWVWRETPDCATNHSLSYARSKDLLHWENVKGKKINSPITFEDKSLIVDGSLPGRGLFNPGIRLGFDPQGKVIIGYHRYDMDMNTQMFISRFENGQWTNQQLTEWDLKWIFYGGGSVGDSKLIIDTPESQPDGTIAFGYHRKDKENGDGVLILDGKTLKPIGERPYTYPYPIEIDKVESDFPGMRVNKSSGFLWAEDHDDISYMLRWETLTSNRDTLRSGPLPPPSMLKVYKIIKE